MSTKSQFSQLEEEMLKLWDKEQTFSKSLEQRKGKELYSFYDGPPFANGLPHFGHSLVQSIKDSMLRYKTMRGYYVPRRNGWDCHGLPVEYAIEQAFKVSGKREIMELGLEKFNAACRDSIFKYKDEWEGLLKRIGRWSDYEHYYATVDTTYTESVWWVLKQVHEKGLLYRGLRSLPYCPRCATPLSNFELNEGYKDNVKDPSLYVLFPLKTDPKRAFVAWTTTPWSLPANIMLAVDEKADYVTVEVKGQKKHLVLAKKLVETVLNNEEYRIIKTQKGSELVGEGYEPLYPVTGVENAYKVYSSTGVNLEEGTGILHVAPRYGETDLELGLKHNLPLIESVDDNGLATDVFPEAKGQFFKDADVTIIANLTKQDKVFAVDDSFTHTYPFCWRCDTPLFYYSITAWMVEVAKIRQQLLKTAEEINWTPAHIKKGRFGKWLEGARDWTISRNRYWGAPMPIWQNVADENDYIVVGSIEELKQLAGSQVKVEDLHRPYIDNISFEKDGKTYKRIEEVIDCWFESGSMSVAQQHYPFENKDNFKHTFPADFIIEGLDQTRLWFYVQHVVATILFNKPAFKNVIVNGMIMAADGQKLSKRLRNYPPLEEVFEHEGADSLRLFLLSSVQATETADYMRFNRDGLRDVQRNVLMTWWNVFNFYKTYTQTEKWSFDKTQDKQPESKNVLDQWILARLNQTIAEVTKQADSYFIAKSVQAIMELIDDLSNWYVRRSRRRFWKNEDKADKESAFETLHYVLVKLSQLMAPWAPFLSDKIYRELRTEDMPESVHLTDWPKAGKINEEMMNQMSAVRELITEGLALRAQNNLKVRQPLASVTVSSPTHFEEELLAILQSEINVKEVKHELSKDTFIELDTSLSHELKLEGMAREVIRHVQQYRKELGLNVSDKINLSIQVEDGELKEAIQAFEDTIKDETISKNLELASSEQEKPVSIEGKKLTLSAKKVG